MLQQHLDPLYHQDSQKLRGKLTPDAANSTSIAAATMAIGKKKPLKNKVNIKTMLEAKTHQLHHPRVIQHSQAWGSGTEASITILSMKEI